VRSTAFFIKTGYGIIICIYWSYRLSKRYLIFELRNVFWFESEMICKHDNFFSARSVTIARGTDDSVRGRNEEFPGIYYRARRDAWVDEAEQGDIQSASPRSFFLFFLPRLAIDARPARTYTRRSDNKNQQFLTALPRERVLTYILGLRPSVATYL